MTSRLSQDRVASAFVVTAAVVLIELLRRAAAVGPIGPAGARSGSGHRRRRM